MLAGVRKFCRYQVDSGWAWVVCFASFFGHFVLFGTIQSFGTLFISLLNDFNSGESATATFFGLYTAWVGSLGYGFLFVIGPITAVLCEHFGCRVMACTGSVLATFSLLVTSFAPSISIMYFTFGVLWGTGGSFMFFSGLLILRFYFNRNISLANGITMTGAGFGTLIFNVMLQELDDKYGWRGGLRVLSVFSALTFLCGCAYIPPPVDYLPFDRPSLWFRLKRLIDPRPWKERAFTMWVVALCFILFAYFFPYTYLVRMALTLGIPVSQGALLLGYFSISAIFGKLLCGRLADLPRVRRLYIFVISATVLSLSSMCVTAAKTYHGLIAYTLVAGFFDGCFVVTVPLITQDIVGKELMAKALGNQYGIVAFPLTLGPPVLGELYKSTNSFKTAFFVSSGFVLVGVSLIYIVQRIRPDLVRRQEPSREEVYDSSLIPTPSIHSASVVDTLSGLFVMEPALSTSTLDPVEVGSYHRFDSFRREDSRATYLEPVHGRMANQTEIEAVYRQAVDNLSTTSGVKGHHRDESDTSDISKVNGPEQSRSGSVYSGSLQSSAEVPIGLGDSPSGLQSTTEATGILPKESESCTTLVDANVERSPHVDDGGINIPGASKTVYEGDKQEQLSVTPEKYGTPTSPVIDTQASLEAAGIEKSESDMSSLFRESQRLQVEQERKELISPEQVTTENRDMEFEVEFKLPPPPEGNLKRRTSPLEQSVEENGTVSFPSTDVFCNDLDKAVIPMTEVDTSEDILQDGNGSIRIPVAMTSPPEREEDVERQVEVDALEMVRIPPPPAVPRTGQLVALESEHPEDQTTTSPSEVKLNSDQDYLYEKDAVADNASCVSYGNVVASQRKERLHLAIIDQLNMLSERLEAVAARQIQEEEQEEGDQSDQRPPFSPALQSLPLTPLYSANQSVPLTPVRAPSSFLNTPAPTPRQTPPSAFLTTAPTPIYTPRTPAQGVSGICSPNDVPGANPSGSNVYETEQINIHNFNNWDDKMDVCSFSPSQTDTSRHRSRSSSYSEVGQEFVLNEWSPRDSQGSAEAFSSKPSSGTNSSVSNSARSLADLNNVSAPIDIVDIAINENHARHVNSPENFNPNQHLENSAVLILPEKPYVQYENTAASGQSPFPQPCLDTSFNSMAELQTDQVNGPYQVGETLAQEVPLVEHFNIKLSLPQLNCQNATGPKENENLPEIPLEIQPDTGFLFCQPESVSILQPEEFSNNFAASEPQQPLEVIARLSEIQMQQTHFDPCLPNSKFNPFLTSEQYEVCQSNTFQRPSDGLSDGSQDLTQIPAGLVSQDEVTLPVYQSARIPIEQGQIVAEETKATSPPPVTDSYSQQVLAQQNNFPEANLCRRPEESHTGVTEQTSIPSEDAIQKTNEQSSDQSTWTMFFPIQEVIIFEMDTESESSSDSGVKVENNSVSMSRDSTIGDQNLCTADQDGLFPPLQMFSDMMDITATENSHDVSLKLPPPPRQVRRKRMDTPVSPKTEQIFPHTTGEEGRSKQTSLVEKHKVIETGQAPDTKIGIVHGSQEALSLDGNVETRPVPSDGDYSATGCSVSEIESDLQTECTFDELTQKLSDDSISGTVSQEFELINHEGETVTREETDSSNLDGDRTMASIHDDFAPLLLQNDERIQYVNLGDLPEGSHVLQKRPSTTSSTDDSSTSTDSSSSLSENEMPYSKLHEDTPEQG